MAGTRKSFLIHIDSLDILDDLTDEQAGQLFKKIKAHQKNEKMEVQPLIKIAFSPFKNQFQRDDEKYEKTVERNRNNGLKGGRPKTQEIPEEPKKPTGLSGDPEEPKKADSDSGNDSDNDSGNKDNNDNKDISPIGEPCTKKPKSKKIEFEESKVVDVWNDLGCVRHNKITKAARGSIEKSYKEYLSDCNKSDKEPQEATDWIINYLKSGFAKWMTDHHRQLNDGQWAADLEFAMRPATYEKVKSTIVTNRTAATQSSGHNNNQSISNSAQRKSSLDDEIRELMGSGL